jgi:hypothetical protein
MTFTVGLGPQWKKEWPNYQPDQRYRVGLFVQTFLVHGLDATKFQGRISPSWMNLAQGSVLHTYTTTHWLWHYHIGLPMYRQAMGGDVSDEVLHFQWVYNSKHVDLIELSPHYLGGKFFLPLAASLAATPAPTPPPATQAPNSKP